MRHDPRKLREDIRLAIADAEMLFRGKSFDDVKSDRALQLMAERVLEIIGEALSRLRRDHPMMATRVRDIDKIIGLRNILAHGYDALDYEILWDVIENRLDVLKGDMEFISEPSSPEAKIPESED